MVYMAEMTTTDEKFHCLSFVNFVNHAVPMNHYPIKKNHLCKVEFGVKLIAILRRFQGHWAYLKLEAKRLAVRANFLSMQVVSGT